MEIMVAVWVWLAAALAAQTAPHIRTVEIGGRPTAYEVRGNYAVVQGDIIIGTAAEVEAASGRDSAVVLPGGGVSYWPGGTMYYTIDANIPNQQRLLDAVKHWNDRTPLQILPRTNQPNYVRFVRDLTMDAACSSYLGMRGGEQTIQTTDGCTSGSAIHELGHAWGLEHEQVRADRNAWVTILYQNIDQRFYSDFDQSPASMRDVSYYDYDSVMHYGPAAFTRTGQDSIATVPVGIPIGQRNGLSAGDIDSISRLYGFAPSATTITTAPAGLPMVVDSVAAQSPQSYNWAVGSTHTIAVPTASGTDPRYVFVRWSDGGAATHTITASREQTVFCAVFQVQHQFAIGVAAGRGTAAAAPTPTGGYYPERLPVRVTATADAGSQFLAWTGYTNLQASGYSISAASAIIDVALTNSRFLANFSTAPLTTIDSKPPGRTVTVDGTSYTTPVRFAWVQGSSHVLGVAASQTAGNNTARFDFTGWEDLPFGARAITAGSGAATYTANFTTKYLLSVSTIGTGQVTKSPASPDGYYAAGTTVQLTAQPGTGSVLRYWMGDLAGGSLTPTITVDEPCAVTAYFASAISYRVVSAASYTGNPVFSSTVTVVAPGELVTIFGAGIGPAALVKGGLDANGRLATSVGGTRVLFDTAPAPIVYTSRDQIGAVVPAGVAGKTSTVVRIENGGVGGPALSIGVGDTAPALFTLDASGTGPVAALNQDGSVNSAGNAATPGSVVVLYATGASLGVEDVPDGQIMGAHLVAPRAPVFVRVGKLAAEVLYAGSAPYMVSGVLQVNARLPAELLGGAAVPIQIVAGTYSSPPGTTLAVR
jgi:uncharacterized protein (TIGR03437 family)